MADEPKKELSEGEQFALLWRLLQSFCWAFVATGGLLAVVVGPILDKPDLVWTGLIPATPALIVIVWAEVKIRALKGAKK